MPEWSSVLVNVHTQNIRLGRRWGTNALAYFAKHGRSRRKSFSALAHGFAHHICSESLDITKVVVSNAIQATRMGASPLGRLTFCRQTFCRKSLCLKRLVALLKESNTGHKIVQIWSI